MIKAIIHPRLSINAALPDYSMLIITSEYTIKHCRSQFLYWFSLCGAHLQQPRCTCVCDPADWLPTITTSTTTELRDRENGVWCSAARVRDHTSRVWHENMYGCMCEESYVLQYTMVLLSKVLLSRPRKHLHTKVLN